jgi:hypothetical protein
MPACDSLTNFELRATIARREKVKLKVARVSAMMSVLDCTSFVRLESSCAKDVRLPQSKLVAPENVVSGPQKRGSCSKGLRKRGRWKMESVERSSMSESNGYQPTRRPRSRSTGTSIRVSERSSASKVAGQVTSNA